LTLYYFVLEFATRNIQRLHCAVEIWYFIRGDKQLSYRWSHRACIWKNKERSRTFDRSRTFI